jgi:hypothetical protein
VKKKFFQCAVSETRIHVSPSHTSVAQATLERNIVLETYSGAAPSKRPYKILPAGSSLRPRHGAALPGSLYRTGITCLRRCTGTNLPLDAKSRAYLHAGPFKVASEWTEARVRKD